MSTQARWKIPLIIGGVGVVLAVLFAIFASSPPPEEAPPREVASAPASPTPAPPPAPTPRVTAPSDSLEKFLAPSAPAETPAEPEQEYPIKLDELQARLPDNLYWTLDAPTKDPQVLQKRAEEKRKWSELFGKVQAGDASEEEIHRYYDHRRQRSEDYIEIASLMLTEYGDRLPERDQGLIALSVRMHRDRLKEVPRQLEDALARKELQDKRREEWNRNGKAP